MTFKPYPKYKASGVEWLGDVPEGWKVAAVGYRYEVALGKMLDQKRIVGNHLAPYLRNTDVQWGRINTTALPEMDFDEADRIRYSLRPGDLLVCEGGDVGRSAIWNIDGEYYYQKALHRMRPFRPTEDVPAFMFYLLVCAAAQERFTGPIGKSTIVHLPAEALRAYRFGFPISGQEQTDIATLLDRETAKIDTLIAKQEKLIQLLQEKRQAVISRSVTKGLDPKVPMKRSGVEWLGNVPEHWNVGALRNFATFGTGSTPDRSNERYWDGDIPWVKTGEINYSIITATEETISHAALNSCSVTLSPPGTLLLALYGQGVTRGRVAVLGIHATYNQACAAIQAGNRLNVDFLHAFFVFAYRYIRNMGNETTQMNLNIEFVKRISVVVPPLSEQTAIVQYISLTSAKIDRLIAKAQQAIVLQKEHRTALISAAVTGKIDVRSEIEVAIIEDIVQMLDE